MLLKMKCAPYPSQLNCFSFKCRHKLSLSDEGKVKERNFEDLHGVIKCGILVKMLTIVAAYR